MRSLADFEFNKAPLCEGMILACEAIRRDFPSQDVYDELERLVSLAKEEISQLLPLEEQLERLKHKNEILQQENDFLKRVRFINRKQIAKQSKNKQ